MLLKQKQAAGEAKSFRLRSWRLLGFTNPSSLLSDPLMTYLAKQHGCLETQSSDPSCTSSVNKHGPHSWQKKIELRLAVPANIRILTTLPVHSFSRLAVRLTQERYALP